MLHVGLVVAGLEFIVLDELPLDDGLLHPAKRDHVLVLAGEPHVRHVAAVPSVPVVTLIPTVGWEPEELECRVVVGCDDHFLGFGAVDRVDVIALGNVGPYPLDGPPVGRGEALPGLGSEDLRAVDHGFSLLVFLSVSDDYRVDLIREVNETNELAVQRAHDDARTSPGEVHGGNVIVEPGDDGHLLEMLLDVVEEHLAVRLAVGHQ